MTLAIEAIATTDLGKDNLTAWLCWHAAAHQLTYLLAHADDGVIWGRFTTTDAATTLTTSHEADAAFPALRLTTLGQCRVFGPTAELLLWRDGSSWRARLVRDTPDYLIEQQVLWGTIATARSLGFTTLEDGQQGLRHIVPIDVPADYFRSDGGTPQRTPDGRDLYRPLRLVVHHLLDTDPLTGATFIALSRLVDLETRLPRKETPR
jgi:CRISPR-associated protein (TIGR03984 family)